MSKWMDDIANWARGISKYYNKTKHFQPDLTPDPSVAGILGRFMAIAIRHVAVRQALVGPDSESQNLIVDAESMRALEGLAYIRLGDDCWPTYHVLTERADEDDADEADEESLM
ncbi:hypothetical protein [Arthrobacter sp. CAU 1506]|uniref:hypothetical protein n=1 Tax=Arthrobacter sp. CAU 1506 TaxID=2560052 RepID=UPI00197A826B|nr:hypothetical protein [Arthrobacter sp. CAU 1506]